MKWYALVVLTLINLLNYLDRYIVAGVMGRLQGEFTLDDAEGGWVASIFMLVYMFASPVGGYLGDRMSRRVLVAIAVAIWSLATIGSGLAPTFGWLLVARAVTGIGEAGYGTTAPSILSDLFTLKWRGMVLSIFYTALPVGAAAGFVIGGAFAEHTTWRHAFFAGGIPGLLFALLALVMPEPVRGATEETKHEKIPFAEGLRSIGSSAQFWYSTIGLTLMTFSIGGLGFWMPKYLSTMRGFTPTEAGLTLGATTVLSGIVGTLLGGALGDSLERRFGGAGVAVSAIGFLIGAPLMVLSVQLDSPWRVVIAGLSINPPVFFALTAAQLCIFLNNGPLNAALLNSVAPPVRAFAFGVAMLLMHLFGDVSSPTLIGAISNRSNLGVAIMLNAIPVAAGGIVLLTGLKHWRKPKLDVQPV